MNLKDNLRKVVNHDIILVRESKHPKYLEFRMQARTRADRKNVVLRHELGFHAPQKSGKPHVLLIVWIRSTILASSPASWQPRNFLQTCVFILFSSLHLQRVLQYYVQKKYTLEIRERLGL